MIAIKRFAATALAAVLVASGLPARASTFTVSGSGSTFAITRSGDTNAAETVRYRTVPLSAFPWQHYSATNGVIAFAPGQTSTNIVVSERTPNANAYKYQTGTTRTYRFEVLSWQGAALASADRSKSSGTSIPSSGAFSEKSLAILTPSAETMYSDKGYLKNAYGTNSISRFFTATDTPKAFYELVGAELRMTLDFKAKEKNNGYQYVQILVDNTTTCDDRSGSGITDGNPGNPVLSRYMAGFDHVPSHENTTYALYSFPVTSQTNNCATVENAWNNGVNNKLYTQKFNTNCRAADGKLILPWNFSDLVVRFNASGGGNDHDEWYTTNVVAHIQAVDTTNPKLYNNSTADIVVDPGPHYKGGTFYVSVPFGEIVYSAGAPKRLSTTWGDANYLAGDGSNVLTFKGTITADVGTELRVSNYNGSVRDAYGNYFQGSISKTFGGTVVEMIPWSGSGTEADPYVITTTNQLNYLASRVNANLNDADFHGEFFELGADIVYAHTTDWSADPDYEENNFVPIGRYGRPFKGHFDGKGHTVRGIRVCKSNSSATNDHTGEYLGLFGFLGTGGTVKNIFLRDASIHGKTYLGGIAGCNEGIVTNCVLYNVRVGLLVINLNPLMDIVAGYTGGTVSGSHYRDCCIGLVNSDGYSGTPANDVFTVTPAADVSTAFVSGESVTIDGATYYTAGSAFSLSYIGAATAVPANWSVVYAATGAAAVSSSTLSLAAADSTVFVARFAPPADYVAHWQADADRDGTTAERAYVITTPEGLELLSSEVNGGKISNQHFQLGDDIDMGAITNFTPIGDSTCHFDGNFDGGGHTISGLTVDIDGNRVGLFGYNCGKVSNVTICDATITGNFNVGGIVGHNNSGTVQNCHVVRSAISARNYRSGAIIGGYDNNGLHDGNTYHSTLAYDDASRGFYADVDAFNIGIGYNGDIHGDTSGAALDPSCLLLPTNAPAFRADLIAAYADPAAHTAHYAAAPDLSGLVVTSGVTRLYAVTNIVPDDLSVSGTDVVLTGLGRSYFAPGDIVTLVPPEGYVIVAASYTDASGTYSIGGTDFAYAFPMPAADVSVAATLAPASGYCGRADANGGQNVVWSFDLATGALAVSTNAAAVGTDFSMADYASNALDAIPWAALKPYIRSVSVAPGVASVGNYAFYGCTALASLSIGGDVVRIGTGAFFGCTDLVTVDGGANVTRVGYNAFGNLHGDATPWLRAQPAGVVYFGKVAIAFQPGGGTAVEIAAGTVSIAPCAFNPSPVTSVVIPESVVHIGEQALGDCDDLAAVYLLPAAPPAFDAPDYLFARGGLYPDPDLLFYVRGTAYADAWSGVWDWMADYSDWTANNRILIGTVSCADGITFSGASVLTHGGTNYYAVGTEIELYGGPPAPVPAGYTGQLAGYFVNGHPVGVSFAMPERDATVTPRWAVIDFEIGHAGTEQDPYVIYNKDQLDLLAERVNGGNGYYGKFIRLGADIAYDPTALDENGENYTVIGGYHDGGYKRFRGTFDGAGHTVRGIRINKTGSYNADSWQGLFGSVYNGTVRNVTLADSVIVGYLYVGGIAGQHEGGALVNCRVENSVAVGAGYKSANYHGGIVGLRYGSIHGCFSAATVTNNGKGTCMCYGGIAGETHGVIHDCLALGCTVTAGNYQGAIVGEDSCASFTNNYYAACTVNGMTNATNVGCNGRDIDGARHAHTITLGPGVRIVGEETVYSNNCLTAIGDSALRYASGGATNTYSGAGQVLALAGGPDGYIVTKSDDGSNVTATILNGDTLTMPDYDITVVPYVLSDWERLQARLNAGGVITLANDVTATADDSTLTVTNAVSLDLAGHTITGNGSTTIIRILSGGDLTLTNSVEGAGAITYGAGCVAVDGGAFTMTGGALTNSTDAIANLCPGGGGVFVWSGTFTMTGGEVSGCHIYPANGGGVYVGNRCTFTMTGGTISGNEAFTGAGVHVNGGGTFTMTGGAIANNTANLDGGGVYTSGSFALDGSEISGNKAYNGGGLYVVGTTTLTNATIVGNCASDLGGGVYVYGGTTTMPNGTIAGNCASSGGGVYVRSGSLEVSGTPAISGNTNILGKAGNVFLKATKTISVSDRLAEGASIGVVTEWPLEPGGSPITITTGAAAGDSQYFFSDNPNYSVGTAANGQVCLTYGTVYPAYLDGSDEFVKTNWVNWATHYGANTNAEYESHFLLDLPPWTAFPEGAAPLRIVEMGVTNIPTAMSDLGYIAMAMGYTGEELPCRRLVLASDVAELRRREDFDTAFEACNGYLVLRIGTDLTLPLDEWLAFSWIIGFNDGRGEIVFPELFMEGIRANFERTAGKPVNGLFLRPCISPVPHLEWLNELGTLVEGP